MFRFYLLVLRARKVERLRRARACAFSKHTHNTHIHTHEGECFGTACVRVCFRVATEVCNHHVHT